MLQRHEVFVVVIWDKGGNSRFLQMSFRDGIRRGEVEASFPLRQAKQTSFSSNGSRPIAVQKSIPKT
jgi:hypothetical protein